MFNRNTYHQSQATPRQHGRMSDESKMGLLLTLIALLAFGSYTLFFLIGLGRDLLG